MAAKGSGSGGRPAPVASPPKAAASPPPAPAVRAAAANPPAAARAATQAAVVANKAPSQSNIAKAVTAAKVAQAGQAAVQAAKTPTNPYQTQAQARAQAQAAKTPTNPYQAQAQAQARAQAQAGRAPTNPYQAQAQARAQAQATAQAQAAIAARRYEGQAAQAARAATSPTVSNVLRTSFVSSPQQAQAFKNQAQSYLQAQSRKITSGTVTSAISAGKEAKIIKPSTVGVTNPNVGRVTTQTGRTTVGGGTAGLGFVGAGGKTTTGGGKTQSTSGLTPRQENEKLRQDLLNAQSQGNVTLVNQISKQLLQGNRNNQNVRDLINATKIDTRFTLSEQNRQKAEQMLAEGKQTEAESYIRAADAYRNSMSEMFAARGNKIKNDRLKQEVADRTVAQTQRVSATWAKVFKPTPPVTEVIEDPVPEVQPFIFSPPPFIPSPPAQTLSPGRDVINFTSEMASPEALEQLYFELISGYELVNIARRDTIDGQSEAYTLISNLSSIRRDLDPSIIIYAQEPFRFTYDRYAIDLNDRIPGDQYLSNNNIDSFFYIDDNGDLVIELDNLKNDEEIELQIANSGKIT